jgi:predicted DNA-binding WGR domain protein
MWDDEPMERILFYRNAKENSDKIYILQLCETAKEDEWIVKAMWGPRNAWSPNQKQTKIRCGRLAAEKEFNQVLGEKLRKGYQAGSIEFVPSGWLHYCLTKRPVRSTLKGN